MQLVLLLGAKLQNIIATLVLESVGANGFFAGERLKPRDELFWFKNPELLLYLIHFVLFQVNTTWGKDSTFSKYLIFFIYTKIFGSSITSVGWFRSNILTTCRFFFLQILQNAFELASFFWFWVCSVASVLLKMILFSVWSGLHSISYNFIVLLFSIWYYYILLTFCNFFAVAIWLWLMLY